MFSNGEVGLAYGARVSVRSGDVVRRKEEARKWLLVGLSCALLGLRDAATHRIRCLGMPSAFNGSHRKAIVYKRETWSTVVRRYSPQIACIVRLCGVSLLLSALIKRKGERKRTEQLGGGDREGGRRETGTGGEQNIVTI